jgi:hypothetical protein
MLEIVVTAAWSTDQLYLTWDDQFFIRTACRGDGRCRCRRQRRVQTLDQESSDPDGTVASSGSRAATAPDRQFPVTHHPKLAIRYRRICQPGLISSSGLITASIPAGTLAVSAALMDRAVA